MRVILRARVVRLPSPFHATCVELVCSLRVFGIWAVLCDNTRFGLFASQPATVHSASLAAESGRVPSTSGFERRPALGRVGPLRL